MKNVVVLICFLLAVISCKKQPVEKPDVLIEEDKMVEILYDYTILQAAKNNSASKLVQNNIDFNTYILEKYNIDSLTYVQNQLYYASIPERYNKIHNEVLLRLETKKKALDSIKTTTQKKDTTQAKPKIKKEAILEQLGNN